MGTPIVTTQVAIRDYQATDETPVIALLNLALGTARAFERSPAFFRWKHLENPFGRSLMLLADSEKVVGLRAFLRWQFRAGGQTIRAVRAVDTATHPEFQRMGIFSRLTSACLDRARAEGVHLVFNTPNQYSMPGYLKLGWTHVGRSTVFVRPLRPARMLRSVLAPRLGLSLEGERDEVSRWASVDTLLENEGGVADLLMHDDAHLAVGIRTARSPAFLRWRYARVPSLRYAAHWVERGGLRAAGIFRLTRRRGLQELMICELFMEEAQDGRRLVRDALRTSKADYAVAHCAWTTPHRRVLLSLGFVPVPRGPHFTVRPLTNSLPIDPTILTSWRLALGDLEVF